ncbi:MAG: DUF21 domain-containing protein, partial [Acidimicrobiia bacterium]|nr:DUF21 domain-containing protein [Acidimicrobiia bacterium]
MASRPARRRRRGRPRAAVEAKEASTRRYRSRFGVLCVGRPLRWSGAIPVVAAPVLPLDAENRLLTVLGLLAVAALIAANAYFVAAEFSYVAARRARLLEAEEKGDKRAGRAIQVLGRLSFMLSGAQLGITVTSLVVGFIAQPTIGAALEPVVGFLGVSESARPGIALTVGFVLATATQMVFGELAPKNLAIAKPEPVALSLAKSLVVFLKVSRPIIMLFDGSANRLLRRLGIEPVEELHGGVHADELPL